MADNIGTWNKVTYTSDVDVKVSLTTISTNYDLPDITLPSITGATIVYAAFRVNIRTIYNETAATVTAITSGNIAINKTGGSYTNMTTLKASQLKVDSANDTHQNGCTITSNSNVTAIVDTFGTYYSLQFGNAIASSNTLDLYDVYWELDVYFTLDSGVEAKVDAIDINIDDIPSEANAKTFNSTALASINTECDTALTDYDPPTRAEATTDKDDIIVEIEANTDPIKVDTGTTIPALIGTPVADISTDIATNLTAITSIQNNTRFTSAIPSQMQKPDASSTAFRWTANLYDSDGNMEYPVNNEILVRVLQADGTAITANLYKEVGMSNGLDDATDQVNFDTALGWRALETSAIGRFDMFYKVASDETEEALTIEFGWDEGSVIMSAYRATEVVDSTGDLTHISDTVDSILVDTGTTIPAQITTHDTDIKALQRIEGCPSLMYVPEGMTDINDEDGITAVVTTIPVTLSDNLTSAGIVLIESEYVIYTGISGGNLTGCTRGAYSTSGATHADAVAVYQAVLFPIRLTIKDNEGNMLAPDSIPTLTITDWNGTEELAPAAMTLISTGVYGYNYIVDYGDLAENKIFKYTTIIDSITATSRDEVVIINQPASYSDVVAGGTGDYVCDQGGWYSTAGILTAWTDSGVGYVRDSVTGAPLDDAYVTAYPIIGGETIYSGRPTAQARTRSNGTWLMNIDAGTYTFVIEKEGFQIIGDGVFERTVG